MCKSNYITKHYAITTYGLCFLFVVALGISAWISFDTEIKQLNYGILILLFADVTLAVMTIVSMVAMFREVSRLHAREFPKDVIDQMNKLGGKLDQLSKDFKTEKIQIEKTTSLSDDCAKLKEKEDEIDCKLNGITHQLENDGESRNKKKITDMINNLISKIRNHFSSKREKQPKTPIPADTTAEQNEETKVPGKEN